MGTIIYSDSPDAEVVTQEQMDEMVAKRLRAFVKENPQFVTAMALWTKNAEGDLEMKIVGLKTFP